MGTSRGNSRVLRFDGMGAFMDTFVPQGTGGMNAPNSICFGSGVLAMRKDRRNRLSNQAT
jgi:hypothetical protein